jgi:ATP-dependent helicase HepA
MAPLWVAELVVQDFIPGQRWVSSAEPDLGLGMVVAVEHRTVSLVFPASGETRTYARDGSPLSRVIFAPGDSIPDSDNNRLTVESVIERNGLLSYRGSDEQGRQAVIDERALNAGMQLNRPAERLFSYQFDAGHLFELRYRSWQHRHRLAQSALYGLTGCRTSLIPHQLYIAHEVAGRYAPRVLLADEVGLGKTIEAGLIVHQQLLTERARRVLILVPESLLHQWLVEMLRRFNLMFSIFDSARCQSLEDSNPGDNPFHSEQLILCSLAFLAASPRHHEQVLNGDWDLLVVDEAHHLHWSPQQSSPEYRLVEQLAARTPGVLLLTATPEQLGRAGHFARLRLLDPHRFPDLDSFIREEAGYAPVARAVEHLLGDLPLDGERQAALKQVLQDSDTDALLARLQLSPGDSDEHRAVRQTLVERLLDRHGTGRILFRNTRAAVQGFPARQLHAMALPAPPAYTATEETGNDRYLTTPERRYAETGLTPAWTAVDPRIAWLPARLQALKPDKVLVIAARMQTVIELADALYSRYGIHAAVFHEGLTLVERDRAAAFFADRDAGTQVMICSEIGSEGRNFQFARHLVLFDLPLNPDLLEQRIGRLDRIGQTQAVQIHLPYLEGTAQAVLFHWYHAALNAFEQTCPAGPQIYAALEVPLLALCRAPRQSAAALIEQAAAMHAELDQALQQGRDRLLEYNSCRQPAADLLCEQARRMENPAELTDYAETLLDAFGVDTAPHSEGCLIARPGEQMLHPVPGLPDDGLTITCDREVALAFEDAHYLSWEHPMLRDTMDMLLTSEPGNCTVCAVKYAGARPGTLLLECLYILESGHRDLVRQYHLAPMLIRVVLDEQGRAHHATLTPELVTAHGTTLDSRTSRQIVQAREQVLRKLLQSCELQAGEYAPGLVSTAAEQRRRRLQAEIHRLHALSRVNPAVRDEESAFFEHQLQLLEEILHSVSPRLDAVRVMVAT